MTQASGDCEKSPDIVGAWPTGGQVEEPGLLPGHLCLWSEVATATAGPGRGQGGQGGGMAGKQLARGAGGAGQGGGQGAKLCGVFTPRALRRGSAGQCSSVQCSLIQGSAGKCIVVHYSVVKCSAG